jgi:hypothetical protein
MSEKSSDESDDDNRDSNLLHIPLDDIHVESEEK